MNWDEAKEINRKQMVGWRRLEKDEIIHPGDEIEMSEDDDKLQKWQPTICAGGKAPDPRFIAHRIYRRKVAQ